MDTSNLSSRSRLVRTISGAGLGAVGALGVGGAMIALAPENGMADLAAAAVTRVFLLPIGVLVGAILGRSSTRRA